MFSPSSPDEWSHDAEERAETIVHINARRDADELDRRQAEVTPTDSIGRMAAAWTPEDDR